MVRRKKKISVSAILVVTGMLILAAAWAADTPAFDHKVHLENEMGCADCHEGITTDKGLTRVLPAADLCAGCHDAIYKIAKPPVTKSKLRSLNFVHSEHAEVMKDCSLCHKDLEKAPQTAGSHETCGTCHKESIDQMQCALCHRDMASAGLSKLNRFQHAGNFLAQHGAYASRSAATCTQCHRERFCTECHSKRADIKPSIIYPEATTRNFVHKGDWITMHRLEVRTDESGCLKCHAQKECADCHMRKGLTPTYNESGFRHPTGYLSVHGQEARRDIASCTACHSGSGKGDCTSCHKASAGVNPHPDGWNPGIMTKSDRMCKRCHDD